MLGGPLGLVLYSGQCLLDRRFSLRAASGPWASVAVCVFQMNLRCVKVCIALSTLNNTENSKKTGLGDISVSRVGVVLAVRCCVCALLDDVMMCVFSVTSRGNRFKRVAVGRDSEAKWRLAITQQTRQVWELTNIAWKLVKMVCFF